MTADMTSAQCRMARAALGWSVRDTQENSGVHRNTITRIEQGKASHGPTIAAVRGAFERAGIRFDRDDEWEGVFLPRAHAEPAERPAGE